MKNSILKGFTLIGRSTREQMEKYLSHWGYKNSTEKVDLLFKEGGPIEWKDGLEKIYKAWSAFFPSQGKDPGTPNISGRCSFRWWKAGLEETF